MINYYKKRENKNKIKSRKRRNMIKNIVKKQIKCVGRKTLKKRKKW